MAAALIDLLDALVLTSGARPSREGNVAVGVLDGFANQFWTVRLGSEITTERPAILPADWDVVLLLTRDAADAIAEGRAEPGGGLVEGDTELWESFVATYLSRQSPFALRCQTLSRARSARGSKERMKRS